MSKRKELLDKIDFNLDLCGKDELWIGDVNSNDGFACLTMPTDERGQVEPEDFEMFESLAVLIQHAPQMYRLLKGIDVANTTVEGAITYETTVRMLVESIETSKVKK